MAKRIKILKTVNLSPQNKCKPTRKFMGQNFNFWSASQRHTCKNTATYNLESEGSLGYVSQHCRDVSYSNCTSPHQEWKQKGLGLV